LFKFPWGSPTSPKSPEATKKRHALSGHLIERLLGVIAAAKNPGAARRGEQRAVVRHCMQRVIGVASDAGAAVEEDHLGAGCHGQDKLNIAGSLYNRC
jgi:hypothetical protein